ncbi:hypothetical protein JRO89_XSUnG0003200 [Xanthoceras sorbifolium]|uniref:Uncharacterized protein n=1 Tax=Xanthoceras sorbifolium TaxID=99658 RepID=A0ABQ8H0D7_9ROSI|nr:hypothetical protein JRO89_XSUnG0003200 [Xanthoceras sorbifolium]
MEDDGVQQIKASEDVRNEIGDTALHVATRAAHADFVKQLVTSNYMKENDLEKKNKEGDTAFTLAAMSGNVQLALLMFEKNKKLAMIRDGKKYYPGMLPVQVAALLGLKDMVNYLYTITGEELKNEDRIKLLKNKEGDTAFTLAAMSGNVQLALLMFEKNKKLAMIRDGKKYYPGMLPIQVAALLGLKDMVNYLYTITGEELKNEDRIKLLVTLIDNDSYGKHQFQNILGLPVFVYKRPAMKMLA